MKCQRCDSVRILSASAKCSDSFGCNIGDLEHDGYVPDDVGIGGGDYVKFHLCLDCGQLRGKFPLPVSAMEKLLSDEDVSEFYSNYFKQGQSVELPNILITRAKREASQLSEGFGRFIQKFFDYNTGGYDIVKAPPVEVFIDMYRTNKAGVPE